jgi:hypothetical protein
MCLFCGRQRGHCFWIAVHIITGLTLVRTGAESGEYRLIGVFTLSGPKDVEHFLGTEIEEVVTMTRISRLRTIDGI